MSWADSFEMSQDGEITVLSSGETTLGSGRASFDHAGGEAKAAPSGQHRGLGRPQLDLSLGSSGGEGGEHGEHGTANLLPGRCTRRADRA